jgi:xanthine dehydrogenase YagR molybdenum-binding subunit
VSPAIGATLNRVDGRAKVRGEARYSAEIALPGLAHAILVDSPVANGRITRIDSADAERAAGVLGVLSHLNLPKIPGTPRLLPSLVGLAAPGQSFFPMQDDVIHYAGQHVALVIADTIERAEFAASLLRVEYEFSPPVTQLEQVREQMYEPQRIFGGLLPAHDARGDVAAGLREAAATLDLTYRFTANHHNPIEMSATTASWDDDGKLTLYDSTQGPNASKMTVAELLGISPTMIRVVSHFVGGSFGSKAMIWPHVALAALAARAVRRPVRLMLGRQQMFTGCGHREEQEHRLNLGATPDGRLTGLRFHKYSMTSHHDDWAEPSIESAALAYACPNFEGAYHLARSNTTTPTFTRGPGQATGIFSLECAMDELAERLGLDPIELRLRNFAETDPVSGNPWSSNGLRECYQRGAELFGWPDRNPRPGSHREGNLLIGSGMAAAFYPIAVPANAQRARARLYLDGGAVVEAGVSEFGTGVTTAMVQVAADALGLPVERVRFVGGSSDLPNITAAVGSAGAGAVSAAVHIACTALRDQLIGRAVADEKSPLHGANPEAVTVENGRMRLREGPDTGEAYSTLLARQLTPDMEATGVWNPPALNVGHAMHTFGAQFAEVAVDADLGLVRVRRMVGVFAPGRVLNKKTAHSQLMGGMLWGLSQALLEANRMDPNIGRWANPSLNEYLVAVNADVPDVVVDTIEVRENVVNPLGVKGVGEIGIVGISAAIANAVHHATGRRVRHLPITIEDLL